MAIKRVKRSRMMIRADMLNKGLTICFKDIRTRRCFCYPVDEFFNWLSDNTECLETNSWKKGLYNWAYVPKRYFAFLDQYEVPAIPEGIPTSETRDYRPDERFDDLREYKRVLGHCYVPEPDDRIYDIEEIASEIGWSENRVYNLLVWAKKIRQLYKNMKDREFKQKAGKDISKPEGWLVGIVSDPTDPISEEEFTELREMGFIFETELSAYFEKEPTNESYYYHDESADRAYLINVLTELQKKRSGKK